MSGEVLFGTQHTISAPMPPAQLWAWLLMRVDWMPKGGGIHRRPCAARHPTSICDDTLAWMIELDRLVL